MTGRRDRLAHWNRWHRYVLDRKGLAGDDEIVEAVAFDLAVAVAGVRALDGASSRSLVESFFEGDEELVGAVVAVNDEETVNHLGFQAREPLDIWLEGRDGWAERLGVSIIGTKRFTASSAFQQRVGAFVEMAQVWVEFEGRTVELELFDIHRPAPPLPGGFGRLRSDRRLSGMPAVVGPDQVPELLANDDIWHYGVRIESEAAVEELHRRFQELVAADPGYRLRSEDTVANQWHGSVHTKLANLRHGVEIEFLTYNVDWVDR